MCFAASDMGLHSLFRPVCPNTGLIGTALHTCLVAHYNKEKCLSRCCELVYLILKDV